ncbi:hypothetical protein BC834DRAFT_831510, partial [Gloeopeniophorella convolvens]
SNSADRTIRVCDAATGRTAVGPFTGHWPHASSWVIASPDRQRVASGSDDRSIHALGIATGGSAAAKGKPSPERQCGLLRSHRASHGRRLSSGSHDDTIPVWDTVAQVALRPYGGRKKY